MRTCNRCGATKPLDEFAITKTGKEGRRSTCKTCMNQRQSVRGWRGPSTRLPSHVARQIGL